MGEPPTLETEAARLFLRYAQEIVEALGFCPWARDVRLDGRVRIEVCTAGDADAARTAALAASIEHDEACDVGIVIFPTLTLDRVEFRHFAAAVRERYATRAAKDDSRMAIADFHPNAEPDLVSADRLVAFVRRSPDPLLQLVRERALASVRKAPDLGTRFFDPEALRGTQAPAATESVSERVTRANQRTVERLGVAHVRAQMDAIHDDRDRTYARLGLPAAPWAQVSTRLRTT